MSKTTDNEKGRELCLDMGFDLDNIPNPNNRNRRSLTVGFVDPNRGDNQNPILNARTLHTDDNFTIRIFNITKDDKIKPDYLSLSISFTGAARDQAPQTPVSVPSSALQGAGWHLSQFQNFSIISTKECVASPLFGTQQFPCWYPLIDFNKPSFPCSQHLPEDPQPLENRFNISYLGSFYLTVLLRVCFPSSSQDGGFSIFDYRVDPEMVTSPDGSGSGPFG